MHLTPAGRAVLFAAVVSYPLAWSLGYEELAMIGVAGVTALAVAVVWVLARPRVRVSRSVHPSRVVRGEPAQAQVTVTNPGRWPVLSLRVHDLVGSQVVEATLPRVAPGQERRGSYPLPTTRRGIVDVGPVRVVRDDPLGLVRRAPPVGTTETLWVYPRIYPVSPLPAGRRRDLEGPTHDGASGSITFHALREYVQGDDLRLIHWRSTARTGTLMVRHQADPSQPQADVVLDTHRLSYADDEDFEAAVEAAASVVAASTAHRFPVRLHAGAAMLAAGTGQASSGARPGHGPASGLLDYLTTVERSNEPLLTAVAARLANGPSGRSLVVLTGTPAPAELVAIHALRERYSVLAVVRFDRAAERGIVWDGDVVTLRAPDGDGFAALWSRAA